MRKRDPHLLRHMLTACATLLFAASFATSAAAKDDVEKAGDVLKYAMPATAAGIALLSDDREGFAQFALSYVATMGTAIALKSVIEEDRPDHSDRHSFPSDSAASAFASAAFLDKRYGWRFGLPAYAVASFVGYSRVESDKHHWYDVVAGAALGWGFNQLITTEDETGGITVHPLLATDFVGLNLDLRW